MVYEYLPIQTRHANIYIPMVNNPTQEQRKYYITLLYRAPSVIILLTCKTINEEASAFFKVSKAFQRKIGDYATKYPPQIINACTFKKGSPEWEGPVTEAMVPKILHGLLSISWDAVVRHQGQPNSLHVASASELVSPLLPGFVPGEGHTQFLRQFSLYLCKQFWEPERNPGYVPSSNDRFIFRIALHVDEDALHVDEEARQAFEEVRQARKIKSSYLEVRWLDAMSFFQIGMIPVREFFKGWSNATMARSRVWTQFVTPETTVKGLEDNDKEIRFFLKKFLFREGWADFFNSQEICILLAWRMPSQRFATEWKNGGEIGSGPLLTMFEERAGALQIA